MKKCSDCHYYFQHYDMWKGRSDRIGWCDNSKSTLNKTMADPITNSYGGPVVGVDYRKMEFMGEQTSCVLWKERDMDEIHSEAKAEMEKEKQDHADGQRMAEMARNTVMGYYSRGYE